MKRFFVLICLFSLLNLCLPVSAVTVNAGTDVQIQLLEKISTKKGRLGDYKAIIDSDVIVNNKLVFKSGDKAIVKVIDVEKPGYFGEAGSIGIYSVIAYDTNGNKRELSTSYIVDGKERVWVKVVSLTGIITIILLPLGLFGFVKGCPVIIPGGTVIETSLSEKFEI